MNILQPWNIVFFVGFLVYLGTRHVYQARTQSEEKVESRANAVERCSLIAVILGSLLGPFLYLFTPLLNFANYALPVYAPWIGAVALAVALWLFYRSHDDLGQNWSITLELRKGHELVQGGVYRRVRHPMYSAIFLFSISQGLLLQNWFAGWSALVPFSVLYLIRVPREERMMFDKFGATYLEYMERTGRLVPRIGR